MNYFNKYKSSAPLLTQQIDEFDLDLLREYSLTHNTPLFGNTVVKLMPFIKNRIKIYVTSPNFIGFDRKVADYLNNINVFFDFDKNKCAKGDIFLDCTGDLIDFGKPKAVSELTQSGSKKYEIRNLDIPVVSIDNSRLKLLEDYFGTGEAFVHAFKENVNSNITGKHFIILGFGKVGKGIARSLIKEKSVVTIIDKDLKALEYAQKKSIHFLPLDEKDELKSLIKGAYCFITVTGVTGIISKSWFLNDLLKSNIILANMGGEDEYGELVPSDRVLNNKVPLNFLRDEPTEIKYLDPAFYAHNLCFKLFCEGKIKKGFQPLPEEYDLQILEKWKQHWKEDISDILELFK